MMSAQTKAIIAAIAGGIVGFLGVVAGAMSGEDTLVDVTAQTWILATIAFFTGAGLTGGATYAAPRNVYTDETVDEIDPNPPLAGQPPE